MAKKRFTYLDFLKMLAAFFVIFQHTGNQGYFLFSLYPSNTLHFWIYMFITIFCRFNVPIFFAISGALLINDDLELNIKKWLLKIGKMIFTLVVFSFLYYFYSYLKGEIQFSISNFFIRLFESDWNFSFWYLYSYIALLLTLPLLRKFAVNLNLKEIKYMIFIVIIFNGLIPIVEFVFGHSLNGNLSVDWIISNIVLYPTIGYYLANKFVDKLDIIKLWLIDLLGICCTCIITYYYSISIGACNEGSSQIFMDSFMVIHVFTVFYTAKYFFNNHKISIRLTNMINKIGVSTFGIYLLHIFVMNLKPVRNVLFYLRDVLCLNYMFSVLLYCLVVFLICLGIISVLRKIPVIKKILQ